MHIADQRNHYRNKSSCYAIELQELLNYVKSSKFAEDNMVNSGDIILRITEIQQHIEAAYTSLED